MNDSQPENWENKDVTDTDISKIARFKKNFVNGREAAVQIPLAIQKIMASKETLSSYRKKKKRIQV